MNDEIRGYVFCLDNLDEVIQHKRHIEKLGYELILIKHFEEVIDAQSNAIMRGEIDVPVIFFIDSDVFLKAWDNDRVRLRHLKRKYIGVILVFEGEIKLADRMHDVLIDELELPATKGRIKRLLRNAEKRMHLEIEKSKLKRELGFRVVQMREVQQVGISLSLERDIDKLMGSILTKARQLTNSDAGSMYLVDRKNPGALRFVKAQNDSIDFPFEETEMTLDNTSIAGCSVLNGRIINIADAYEIPEEASYQHSSHWDEMVGYKTKSMLCVPMKKSDGEIIGCLQLINRKVNKKIILADPSKDVEKHVISYDSENKTLISSFASQAAIAIDNSYLLEDIENLIEGLVRASVVAIETRDPATSGHSERVAKMSLELAKAVNDDNEGMYKDVHFSIESLRQLKYAALLHDFGKVSVREEILQKENKLFPWELDNLKWKIEVNKRIRELGAYKEVIDRHISGNGQLNSKVLNNLNQNMMKWKIESNKLLEKISEATLPLPKNEHLLEEIEKYLGITLPLSDGSEIPLISNDELQKLSINYGSLTEEERTEIEAHVEHTVDFLREIPWTKDLKEISKIAGSHHERNNGAGYPEGLILSEIPLESKIMAVTDVYDSLTAWDRPYKEAMSVEEALEILNEDVTQKKLDGELVKLFIEKKIYDSITSEDTEEVEDVAKTEIIEPKAKLSEEFSHFDIDLESELANYSPFDETRTTLPQDYVDLEERRQKALKLKADSVSKEKKKEVEETSLVLENPVYESTDPLEDNTDNVYKALEREREMLASRTKEKSKPKYDFMNDSSIDADLGSKTELKNFVDKIQKEINEENSKDDGNNKSNKPYKE